MGGFDGDSQEFPIQYREDYGKWEIKVKNQDELLDIIEKEYGDQDSVIVIKSLIQKFDQNLLFDAETQKKIKRWQYCRNNPSTPAFPGGFDELPCDYVDFCDIMNDMMTKITEDMRNKHG